MVTLIQVWFEIGNKLVRTCLQCLHLDISPCRPSFGGFELRDFTRKSSETFSVASKRSTEKWMQNGYINLQILSKIPPCSILVLIVSIIVIFDRTEIGWWEAILFTCWTFVVDKIFFGPSQNLDFIRIHIVQHQNHGGVSTQKFGANVTTLRVRTFYFHLFSRIWSEISGRLHKKFIIDTNFSWMWIIGKYIPLIIY